MIKRSLLILILLQATAYTVSAEIVKCPEILNNKKTWGPTDWDYNFDTDFQLENGMTVGALNNPTQLSHLLCIYKDQKRELYINASKEVKDKYEKCIFNKQEKEFSCS